MQYKLTVDMPHLPKGDTVTIAGLGEFVNGKSAIVDEEHAEAFRIFHGTSEDHFDETGSQLLFTSRELGPTLLQAASTMYGVEIETYKEEDPPKKQEDPPKKQEENKATDPAVALATGATQYVESTPEGGDK
jgi:hypothetical protein